MGAAQPHAPAFVFEDETLDYATVEHWSSRVALHLQADGVRPGDRVGLMAPNDVLWPIAAFGILKAGAVLVPLNSRFTAAELRKVLDDAGATAVVTDDSLVGTATEAAESGTPATVVAFAERGRPARRRSGDVPRRPRRGGPDLRHLHQRVHGPIQGRRADQPHAAQHRLRGQPRSRRGSTGARARSWCCRWRSPPGWCGAC